MRQNELMKKEKKHSMIERSSFTPGDNRTSKINEAEKNKQRRSHMVCLSRTVDVVHRSPRFLMLIVLHCLNLKQQIDLSLYDLISITFLMNSLLDLYVQDVLSIVALFSLFSL